MEDKKKKLVTFDSEILEAVGVAAKNDQRSVNAEIQVLLKEALEARKQKGN